MPVLRMGEHWLFITMNYYQRSRAYYREICLSGVDDDDDVSDIIKRSGFSTYPEEEYSVIIETIRHFPHQFDIICDMGCGSGLLLNYIENHIGYPLKLFGVDFVEESIMLANKSFPNYSFICKNVVDYKFPLNLPDKCLIMIDPYHYREDDFEKLIHYYLQLNVSIMIYTYSDVLFGLSYKTIFDFELFKKHKASFCIIKNSINMAIITT